MKTFKNTAAQGEAYIKRLETGTIASMNTEVVQPEGNKHIIAHSETGHHHVMERETVEVRRSTEKKSEGTAVDILYLIVKEPTALEHLRPHDTHEALLFEPGEYKVVLQQEYTPQGFRRVAD